MLRSSFRDTDFGVDVESVVDLSPEYKNAVLPAAVLDWVTAVSVSYDVPGT